MDEREAHKGSVARNIIFLGGIYFLKHYALAVDDLNIARPLILQYEGQVLWPSKEDQLPQYRIELNQHFMDINNLLLKSSLHFMQDKLQQFIKSAEAAISKAKVHPSVYKLSIVEEKQVQIKAINKLKRWLSDDSETLTSEETSLLGAHQVIRLILDKNPLELPKLTHLKHAFWCYDEEKASLNQQRFLFKFERHRLWPNHQIRPQDQEAFDKVWGLAVKC